MHLSKLELKNFRSCYDTTVIFQPGITLLVGENNSGKSNVIQSLQLVTKPLSGRYSRYFEVTDVSAGRRDEVAELNAEFTDLSEIQKAHYITALDLDTGTAHYTTQFVRDPRGSRYSRPTFHAGRLKAGDPEPEQRDKVRHVYLAPLRDAQRELNSGDGQRLTQVIEYLFDKAERDAFVDHAKKQLAKVGQHDVLTRTNREIQKHLGGLTHPVREHAVDLGFVDHELRRLARGLRMKMAEHGIDPVDLADSGLGYANLLFMATVILELRSAADTELTLFLVEEPEAHLHPQLQAVLLHYLEEQVDLSKKKENNEGPSGRIQVICTTHSPNLASSVGIENVVVLRTIAQSQQGERNESRPAASHVGENRGVDQSEKLRPATVAIAIKELGLDPCDLSKISRYLDVTKAALLFARRVLLVEGMAETLLLPSLVKNCLYTGDGSDQVRKRRDFSAVSLLSVDGIDFKPYIQLLLTKWGPCSILDELIILTDGDPDLPELAKSKPAKTESLEHAGPSQQPEGPRENDAEALEPAEVARNRKSDLEKVAGALKAKERLKVFTSMYTFEADLLLSKENHSILEAAYLKQHPRSAHHWKVIANADEPAREFYCNLRRNSKFISKGEFAYDLMFALESDERTQFKCPYYISDAIQAVLGDKSGE